MQKIQDQNKDTVPLSSRLDPHYHPMRLYDFQELKR